MLVCKCDFDAGDGAVIDIIRQIQVNAIESLPHQATALADIHRALDLTEIHLFNTAMSIQRLQVLEPSIDRSISIEELHVVDPTEVS